MANQPALMTLEEWGDLPEDEEGELVDGVLVEEEMPVLAHEALVAWLIYKLRGWLEARGRGGFVFGSEAKFGVGPRRGRKPDVSVYLPRDSALPARTGVVRIPPDVLIEVISETLRDHRRDRVDKVADYAAFGVRWYWLVDPEARTLEILELGADGRYAHAAAAKDEPLTPVPGCQGLVLDVAALWREIERLESPAMPMT